jgi:putative ABC transport system ATP-binding protein
MGGVNMEILRTENLRKSYGKGESKVIALDGVNLSVEKGQFLSIVGSSGSGKSTLLHILGGVDKPTEGKVYIEDREISTLKESELALFRRRKVGLIYQFYNLIPTIDVKKNMLLPLLLDGRTPDNEYFNEIVDILGLGDRLGHYPGQLSGGQQQRVAIGRSLIYRPAIVLADEPTGNLDRNNSNEIIELLKLSNKKYKQTILLITHDERMALETDRIITLEDGNIISDEVIRQ